MPLKKFECSICGAKAPKSLLEHGKFKERMEWLRNHYKKKHPRKFKRWGR
jgi:hypothetical protein